MIVGTLHVLAVNSVQSLFNYYTEQLENTPTLAEIQASNLPKTEAEEKPEEAEAPAQKKTNEKDTKKNPKLPGLLKV